MPRIAPVSIENAPPASKPMMTEIHKQLGGIPNLVGTLANSPAALATWVFTNQALSAGSLERSTREQVSIAVAGMSGCDYCASAHTTIAGLSGVDTEETARNLCGESNDPFLQACIEFALAIVEKRGRLDETDVTAAREAGMTDENMLEILAITTTNLFTNYANHFIQTTNDFPKVEILDCKAITT